MGSVETSGHRQHPGHLQLRFCPSGALLPEDLYPGTWIRTLSLDYNNQAERGL